MADARFLEISLEQYEDERRGFLTQSTATVMVNRSPRHVQLRAEGKQQDRTDDMAFGVLVHEVLLGRGRGFAVAEYNPEAAAAVVGKKGDVFVPKTGPIGVPEFENWLSNPAKAAKAEIEARGLLPVLPRTLRAAEKLARTARENLFEDFGVSLEGNAETSVEWVETARNGAPVKCRGQLDLWDAKRARIYDLKTTNSAHPRVLDRRIMSFGDDIQAAAYTRAIEAIHPELAGRVEFWFLFVEVSTGIVTPMRAEGGMRRLGELRWRRAVDTWERCTRTGHWPGYVTSPHVPTVPEWAIAEEESAFTEEAPPAPQRLQQDEDDDFPF